MANSQYGRYSEGQCISGGCEIAINKTKITGYAESNQSWNSSGGMNASTTGNIYGIYDMSGGAWNFVMGNTSSSETEYQYNPSRSELELPNERYLDKYAYLSAPANKFYSNEQGHLGDATKETMKSFTITSNANNKWYSDYSVFPSVTDPWFVRGGSYNDTLGRHGIFASHAVAYISNFYATFVVLTAQDGNE